MPNKLKLGKSPPSPLVQIGLNSILLRLDPIKRVRWLKEERADIQTIFDYFILKWRGSVRSFEIIHSTRDFLFDSTTVYSKVVKGFILCATRVNIALYTSLNRSEVSQYGYHHPACNMSFKLFCSYRDVPPFPRSN